MKDNKGQMKNKENKKRDEVQRYSIKIHSPHDVSISQGTNKRTIVQPVRDVHIIKYGNKMTQYVT